MLYWITHSEYACMFSESSNIASKKYFQTNLTLWSCCCSLHMHLFTHWQQSWDLLLLKYTAGLLFYKRFGVWTVRVFVEANDYCF